MPVEPAAPAAERSAKPSLPAGHLIWVGGAGLLVLHAVLAWYLTTPGVGTGNDDAVYLLLARSLREWGYADLFYVGTPAQAQYPPGYPAFLALLGAIGGEQPAVFVAANILLSVTGLALVFDVVRRHDPLVALLGLVFLAIDPLLLELAGAFRSEPLFMALTAGSLWLLAHPGPGRRAEGWAVAAAIAAALTRSVGVALLAGIGLSWLARRRWRAVAGLGLAAGLTVGSWLAWTVIAPRQGPGRSYVADATYRPAEVEPGPKQSPPAENPGPEGPAAPGGDPPPPAGMTSPAATPGLAATLGLRARDNIPSYARVLLTTLGVPTLEGTRLDGVAWHLLLGTLSCGRGARCPGRAARGVALPAAPVSGAVAAVHRCSGLLGGPDRRAVAVRTDPEGAGACRDPPAGRDHAGRRPAEDCAPTGRASHLSSWHGPAGQRLS